MPQVLEVGIYLVVQRITEDHLLHPIYTIAGNIACLWIGAQLKISAREKDDVFVL